MGEAVPLTLPQDHRQMDGRAFPRNGPHTPEAADQVVTATHPPGRVGLAGGAAQPIGVPYPSCYCAAPTVFILYGAGPTVVGARG
jgi:hypothetical protein